VHTGGPAAGSTASALQRGNRIDQRQGFLRVISISAGQADCEWDALRITDQMPFAPALGAIGGIRTRLRAATDGPHRATVNDGTRPINFAVARQTAQKREVHQIPDAFLLPIPQAAPTGHPRSEPSSFGNICHGIPLRSTKWMPVRHARSGTLGRPPFGRGGDGGRSGSMRFHSVSGNSTAAINRRR